MQTNMTILEKCWLEGTSDFQQRIPRPSINGIARTAEALQDPMNGDLWNEFRGLMNMIGFTIVLQRAFENPLAVFKKDPLKWGKTIRMVAPKWIKAHAFDDSATDLLRMERVEYEQWFHTVNRMDKYKFDYNETELAWAVADDGGSNSLNMLLSSAVSVAINSDNYDEMLCMINQFAESDKRWKRPIFRHKLSTFPHDDASGAEFLKAVKTYTGKLKFPTVTYNSINVPVFARENELVLFVTPEVDAAVSVDTLARVFNIDQAEAKMRKVVLPYFPIPGVVACLTTEDFFEVRDTKYGIYPFFDPNTLNQLNYLHHQEIVSASPYVPCILFTTDNGTEIPTVTMTTSGAKLTAITDHIKPGGELQLDFNLIGDVTANQNGIKVKPDSALFTVTIDGEPCNSKTYVDRFGILHLQKSGIKDGDKVTITAVSTYINPTGSTTVYTDTLELTATEELHPGECLITYEVTPDHTYGFPTDTVVPADVIVDGGADYIVHTPLTTQETTAKNADGETVAGKWTFTGWKDGAKTVTKLTNVQVDTTLEGSWSFVAQ